MHAGRQISRSAEVGLRDLLSCVRCDLVRNPNVNLSDAVPEGIWVVNPQGRTVFSNRRMAEILGVAFESMPAQSCFACVFPDELADAQRNFARSLAGDRRPFDFRLRRGDGSPVWVSISCMPMCDDTGAPVWLLGLFSDVSERKLAEAALRESEGRFRSMADSAPVLIWLSDCGGRVTFCNRQVLTFTGRTEEQLAGEGFLEPVHPDDVERVNSSARAAVQSQCAFEIELRVRRADGEYRSMLTAGTPRFVGGRYLGHITVTTDITELKRRQDHSLALQKLESLGVLAGGVAHDFNNLLGGVLASVELLLADRMEGLPVEEEVLLRIKTAAIRGGEIVRQLMVFCGEESQTLEPVDISRLVGEMLQLLNVSISKRVILKVDLPKHLSPVRANAAQLRQVVLNLVTNASEALGEHDGVISVSVAQVPSGADGGAPDRSHGDSIRLVVGDTGCGMTEEMQSKIFDPFFTSKFAGRGLGLASVRGVIRGHGGTINVESAPGLGSRFEILLPCSGESTREGNDLMVSTAPAEVASFAGTVLVVEDEDTLRLAVSQMLRRKGFNVIAAANGETGVDLFATSERQIDVALLDLTLPGMSSREVLGELRRIQPGLKVIITSAYSQDWAQTTLGGQHPWLYIRKPYQLGQLAGLLQDVCLEKC
jgi:two-component system, cell cycle sensor histidine kinase and response regulator CckA